MSRHRSQLFKFTILAAAIIAIQDPSVSLGRTIRCEKLIRPAIDWRSFLREIGQPDFTIDPEPRGKVPPRDAENISELILDPRFFRLDKFDLVESVTRIPRIEIEFANLGIKYVGTGTTPLGPMHVLKTPKGASVTLSSAHIDRRVLDAIQRDTIFDGMEFKEDRRLDYLFEVARKDYKNFGYIWNGLVHDHSFDMLEASLIKFPVGYPNGKGLQYFRYLVSKQKTNDVGNFTIEVIETKDGNFPKPPDRESAEYQVREGHRELHDKLIEIFSFYAKTVDEQRDWDQNVVRSLYLKALKKIHHTRFIVIRDAISNDIVSLLALQHASYGKVTYFSKKSGKWIERTGPFGATYALDHEVELDGLIFHDANQWTEGVPLLGAEEHLKIGAKFERPAVIDSVYFPGGGTPRFLKNSALLNDVDLTKPIFFASGEIIEPAHFVVSKDYRFRDQAYGELLTEVIRGIFPERGGSRLPPEAQMLHTYNNRVGILLDRLLGFKRSSTANPISKNGESWSLLSAYGPDFLNHLKDPRFLEPRVARAILGALVRELESVSSRKLPPEGTQ